ncbi:Peptidase family M20/M25/M40 [Corynebacterium spheniscorum]|uniref:Peptidase family M20/M25/M40 n=1 Tax=Corynebacterium spheniscorum TaxID=185761 RepID=A0A1I2UKP6_9CORY|nr:Peptidase family M20/M25/M40 [Corynebacterium spheniscorum]
MEASAQANKALHSIPEAAQELAPELIALRHVLHQIPELALELPHTQNAVLEAIADCSELEITHCNSATGFVAVVRGGHAPTGGSQRPIILLRADMDALPVQETTQLPWASTNGNMHACGHDLHMAGLVGALKIL